MKNFQTEWDRYITEILIHDPDGIQASEINFGNIIHEDLKMNDYSYEKFCLFDGERYSVNNW